MKKSELKEIIRQEIRRVLSESNNDNVNEFMGIGAKLGLSFNDKAIQIAKAKLMAPADKNTLTVGTANRLLSKDQNLMKQKIAEFEALEQLYKTNPSAKKAFEGVVKHINGNGNVNYRVEKSGDTYTYRATTAPASAGAGGTVAQAGVAEAKKKMMKKKMMKKKM